MPHVVVAAREDVITQRAAAPLKPRDQRLARGFHQLKLHRSFGLLLHYHGSVTYASARHDIADGNLDDVAPAKLAVDGEIEQRSVAQTSVLVQPKSDGPYLVRLQGAFCTQHTSFVPGAKLLKSRVYRGVSHGSPPRRRTW